VQGLGSQVESFTRVGRLPPRSPPLLDEGQPRGLNLIQIQKWSFGMWETSPPAAPLLLKERFDKTLVPLLLKATAYT